jgi:hypothetical protein
MRLAGFGLGGSFGEYVERDRAKQSGIAGHRRSDGGGLRFPPSLFERRRKPNPPYKLCRKHFL